MIFTRYVAPAVLFFALNAGGQQTPAPPPHGGARPTKAIPSSEDVDQLRADIQRLRVMVNQMRTNLAFVQTSQTPLKHQFELEADAWQVLIDQMDRRLRQMQARQQFDTVDHDSGK